jgi:protoheme IX farnesyltransferase
MPTTIAMPNPAAAAPPTAETPSVAKSPTLRADVISLCKPGIALMVAVTVGCAALIAGAGRAEIGTTAVAMLAAGLLSAGAGALNHWRERESDKRMRRTARRPLPTGRLAAGSALAFGATLIAVGFGVLWAACNPSAALVGLASAALYIFVYTPMKQRTVWNTTIGAVPGALPVFIGWLAIRPDVTISAWLLFAVLFAWQFPHFYAIAWMYRDDYEAGGMKMFPSTAVGREYTGLQTIAFCLLLFAVTLAPPFVRLGGWPYFVGAALLGAYFVGYAAAFQLRPSPKSARMLMFGSLVYLPSLLGLLATMAVMRG